MPFGARDRDGPYGDPVMRNGDTSRPVEVNLRRLAPYLAVVGVGLVVTGIGKVQQPHAWPTVVAVVAAIMVLLVVGMYVGYRKGRWRPTRK